MWIVPYFSVIFPLGTTTILVGFPYDFPIQIQIFWGFSIHPLPGVVEAALRAVAMQLGHQEVEPLWQHFGAAAAQRFFGKDHMLIGSLDMANPCKSPEKPWQKSQCSLEILFVDVHWMFENVHSCFW